MRITLKPGDTIPANAVFVGAVTRESVTFEVPDPTPPAPKLIVFVADGEPRTYTTDAAPWRLDLSGQFGYLGAYDDQNNYRARAVQHYRQLPAEQTFSLEDLQNMLYWGHVNGEHSDTLYKLSAIIAAIEAAKETQ